MSSTAQGTNPDESAQLWKRLDLRSIGTTSRAFLSADDECWYARESISGGGYAASEGNQLICDFKKPPDRRSRPAEWKHRELAVEKFAIELAGFLPVGASVTTIPTSKRRDDTNYNDRFDALLARLKAKRPDLHIVVPIECNVSMAPLHTKQETRNVQRLKANLRWVGFPGTPPRTLHLVDDVLTAGTHFAACKQLVQQNAKGVRVVGVFWALIVWR